MKILKSVFFLFFLALPVLVFAQEAEEDKLSLNEGTLDNQFEYVIQKSNNYEEYKVVKKTWLYALKAHTMDSLKSMHEEYAKTLAVVDSQAKEITDLKTKLTTTKATLDKTNTEKDSMSLFGIQMSKTGYNALMWTIIAVLLGSLLLFIFKFKNSNTLTRQAQKTLAETELEFEEHRRVALEREQKVRRQLQDELNKQKND